MSGSWSIERSKRVKTKRELVGVQPRAAAEGMLTFKPWSDVENENDTASGMYRYQGIAKQRQRRSDSPGRRGDDAYDSEGKVRFTVFDEPLHKLHCTRNKGGKTRVPRRLPSGLSPLPPMLAAQARTGKPTSRTGERRCWLDPVLHPVFRGCALCCPLRSKLWQVYDTVRVRSKPRRMCQRQGRLAPGYGLD